MDFFLKIFRYILMATKGMKYVSIELVDKYGIN